MGEGKARPTALNGAVNRPHLRRKCLPQKPPPIWRARNGPLAGQGKLAAVFGDGLWLTDPDRDVGRTKPYELCLAGGERALGPLSPFADRCGIPADTIRRIAAELAHVAFNEAIELPIEWTDFRGEKHTSMTGRPVSFHAMRGISAHANGFQTCRAFHVLQILLGSVEVPGGFRFKPPYPKPAEAHPKPHAKCTPCSPLNGPHLGFVQLDSCGRIFFHFQLPQIGARHPAATASASSQNHRSPFSILTFVLLYQGDQGE